MKVKVRLSDEMLKVYGDDAAKYVGAKRRTKEVIIEDVTPKQLAYLESRKNPIDPVLKITKVEKKKPVDKEVKA